MANLLRPLQRSLPLLNRRLQSRPYSALNDNLLRILNNELAYLSDYQPPLQVTLNPNFLRSWQNPNPPFSPLRKPPPYFRSFSIDDRPGEQWIRMKSSNPAKNEEIKVDAALFDGIAPIPEAKKAVYEGEVRLHVSLVVEVSKGEVEGSDSGSDSVLVFICSAWPESIEVQQVFPLRRRDAMVKPYMGRNFKKLSKEVQTAVLGYLEEREIDDELAEFLHQYMANKDKVEVLRWMKTIESYVRK